MRGVAWALETAPGSARSRRSTRAARGCCRSRPTGWCACGISSSAGWSPRARTRAARAGLWVAGGRLLILPPGAPPELLEPAGAAATATALALPPLAHAVASADGARVLARGAEGALVLDVATRATRPLAGPRAPDGLAIAPDGAWLVVTDAAGAHVFDRDGAPLGRHAGAVAAVAASRHGRFALLGSAGLRDVIECRVAPALACAPIDTASLGERRVVLLAYRGAELAVVAGMSVFTWSGDALRERASLTQLANGLHEGPGALVWVEQGNLHALHATGRATLAVPTAFSSSFRIAARDTAPRVALVGDGAILVFELDAAIPRPLAAPGDGRGSSASALFVDADAVLQWGVGAPWRLVGLDGRVRATLPYEHLPAVPHVTDHAGRVVVRVRTGARRERFDLVRAATGEVTTLADGEGAWAHLLAGDAAIFGDADGRVHVRIGGAAAREVMRLDDRIGSAVALGGSRFAVQSAAGEIVRADLATGAIERTRVAGGPDGFVASDGAGRVLVARDNRVFLWDGALVELARFDRPIHRVEPAPGGVVVMLADHQAHLLEPRPGGAVHRLFQPAGAPALIGDGGARVLGADAGNALVAVELPARARWPLPLSHGRGFASSPDGRTLVELTPGGALAAWHVPRAGPDLATWIGAHTNALLDADDVLIWPWQAAGRP